MDSLNGRQHSFYMKTTRRNFIKSAGITAAGITLAPSLGAQMLSASAPQTSKSILILGGTGFIGPNMVKYAVERGHQVAIFTRGNSKSQVEGVEHLIGDRNNDLSALDGREWDVVIDNNASRTYKWVDLSTQALKERCQHYIHISSISAYDFDLIGVDFEDPYSFKDTVLRTPLINEDTKTAQPSADWVMGDEAPYGLMKAISERLVMESFPNNATIVRPGLIVGEGDWTRRWTYWVNRVAEGGEMLAPGNPAHAYQIIDQKDLTEWVVRLAESGKIGVFNAVGPKERLSMNRMLNELKTAFKSNARFTWVEEDFLKDHISNPWSQMPAWLPGSPLTFVSNERAVQAGLTYRTIAQTGKDAYAYDQKLTPEAKKEMEQGISRDLEKEILQKWNSR